MRQTATFVGGPHDGKKVSSVLYWQKWMKAPGANGEIIWYEAVSRDPWIYRYAPEGKPSTVTTWEAG